MDDLQSQRRQKIDNTYSDDFVRTFSKTQLCNRLRLNTTIFPHTLRPNKCFLSTKIKKIRVRDVRDVFRAVVVHELKTTPETSSTLRTTSSSFPFTRTHFPLVWVPVGPKYSSVVVSLFQ